MTWFWKLFGLWCEKHQCRFIRYMGIGSGPGAVDWDWDCPVCMEESWAEDVAYTDMTDQEVLNSDRLRDENDL